MAVLTEANRILLEKVNLLRTQRDNETLPNLEDQVEKLFNASSFFAVYGSLGPGGPNHCHIEDIKGTWWPGFKVTGELKQCGWGAAIGFPGLVWSNNGSSHPVQLLQSDQLRENWQRLDDLEGEGYQRILVPVTNGHNVHVANIYALAGS